MSGSPRVGRGAAAACALALAACAATSNPDPTGVQPAAPAPREPVAAGATSPAPAPAKEPAGAQPTIGPAVVGDPAQTRAEPLAADARLTVGLVGGEPIDAREFLARLWMRDAETAREVFDYLVMSRIALFEADRLGVRIEPPLVDATLERAWEALRKRLADSGSKLTLEQHVRRNLELELADYERKLRSDAIVQLLTERAVRAWYLSNPRIELRLMELSDEASLQAALDALEAGSSFEEVARARAVDVDAKQGGTLLTVVRSETSELARLAFSTPVGEVAGPLVQEGRFLLLRPDRVLEPVEGPWAQVGTQVEASLARTPIDSDRMEYAQWRAAMIRRYPIDLGAFVDLVRDTMP